MAESSTDWFSSQVYRFKGFDQARKFSFLEKWNGRIKGEKNENETVFGKVSVPSVVAESCKGNTVYANQDIGFSHLKDETGDKKENYMDDLFPGEHTEEKIKKRIKVVLDNPGHYSLLRNNCEHLATFLRYGIAKSKQVHGLSHLCVCIFQL